MKENVNLVVDDSDCVSFEDPEELFKQSEEELILARENKNYKNLEDKGMEPSANYQNEESKDREQKRETKKKVFDFAKLIAYISLGGLIAIYAIDTFLVNLNLINSDLRNVLVEIFKTSLTTSIGAILAIKID